MRVLHPVHRGCRPTTSDGPPEEAHVLKSSLGSDVSLTSLLIRVYERQKRYRDYSRCELNAMLREVIACAPGLSHRMFGPRKARSASGTPICVTEAIEAAKQQRPDIDHDLLDFSADPRPPRVRGTLESELVMRFQQNTGPVMAKGIEDTVFYNYNRLGPQRGRGRPGPIRDHARAASRREPQRLRAIGRSRC